MGGWVWVWAAASGGFAVGRRARWIGAASVLGAGVVVVVADLLTHLIGVWDLVAIALVSVLASATGAMAPARALRGVLGLVLGVAVAEVGARAVLPPAPWVPELDRPWMLPLDDDLEVGPGSSLHEAGRACHWLIHAPLPIRAEGDRRPTVLHLGDSMVGRYDRSDPQTFEAWLEARDPARRHLVVSLPGRAPDVTARVAERLLAEVDAVVLYVYAGNDLDELGAILPCCVAGLRGPSPDARRCERPSLAPVWTRTALLSPPPALLHEAARHSRVAGHLIGRLHKLLRQKAARHGLEASVYGVLASIRDLAERAEPMGVGVQVVYLPEPSADPPSLLHGPIVASPWLALDASPIAAAYARTGSLTLDDGVHWRAPAQHALADAVVDALGEAWTAVPRVALAAAPPTAE